MNSKPLAVLALAVAGLSAASLAQARGDVDVQWSVTIGSPVGIYAPQPHLHRAPVIVAQPVYRPYPVYQAYPVYPVHQPYRAGGRGDADRDGIPNRYDRVYNPRWDRDGDGIPNRYDRRDHRQPQYGHGQNDGPPRRGDDRPGR
jgi:hypothetical protein